ncbi:MAG: MFS transporter [Marinovum sp.]|nr:MFS transporter [Marinovum sp.]
MAEHDSVYSWMRLFIGLVIATVGNVGMWVVVLLMPDIQQEFSIDRASASAPFVLTMIGFALGNGFMGRVVDRFGISTTLIFSAIINAVGFSLAMLSQSIFFLSALQFIIGFGTAASFGPLIADVSHWFLKKRGIAVAITASGNYFSGSIWPVVIKGTLETDGWRSVYGLLAVSTVFLMVPLAFMLRRKVSAETSKLSDALSERRREKVNISPNLIVILLSLAGVGCCVAMSMPQVHIVAFCVDLGYGPSAGAEMLSLMLIGGIISRLISGVLADRIGGLFTLLIGSTLQCVALFLYLPFDGLVPLYLISLVFGLSQGGIVPSYAIIVREYLPGVSAGEKVGVVIMATIMGMALGGWMSGWIYDLTGSYQAAFWNGIIWNFLNLGVILILLTRGRGPKNKLKVSEKSTGEVYLS